METFFFYDITFRYCKNHEDYSKLKDADFDRCHACGVWLKGKDLGLYWYVDKESWRGKGKRILCLDCMNSTRNKVFAIPFKDSKLDYNIKEDLSFLKRARIINMWARCPGPNATVNPVVEVIFKRYHVPLHNFKRQPDGERWMYDEDEVKKHHASLVYELGLKVKFEPFYLKVREVGQKDMIEIKVTRVDGNSKLNEIICKTFEIEECVPYFKNQLLTDEMMSELNDGDEIEFVQKNKTTF